MHGLLGKDRHHCRLIADARSRRMRVGSGGHLIVSRQPVSNLIDNSSGSCSMSSTVCQLEVHAAILAYFCDGLSRLSFTPAQFAFLYLCCYFFRCYFSFQASQQNGRFDPACKMSDPMHWVDFYRASICEGGLGSRNSVCLSVCPSVCPSVTRVDCDKTK